MGTEDEDDPTSETLAGWVSGPATTTTPAATVARIGGRYEILNLLGAGGMGTVYRVRDAELDEVVALKRLRPDLAASPGMLARFRQEVKLARRVTHKNVVRTFDLYLDGGEAFLTMEYVDGRSLARRIADDGPLPIGEAVAIASAVCAGIGAAHEAGVLHRDLKPDNVLLGGDGRVVVTDFGIARAAAEAGVARTLGAVGTPAYMAPEQVQGGELGARADLYAIGAILYEALTGKRAWAGDDPFAVAFARLQRPPPDPRDVRRSVPDALAQVVLRCLAREPADRFASAADVVQALASASASPSAATTSGRDFAKTPTSVLSVPADGARTIAVVPFRNGGAPEDGYIADGLTEELVDALSMTRGLRVRPLGAVAAGERADARAVGQRLEVDVVVDGSVRRIGDKLRISARLIGIADGYQLWARRWDVGAEDALVVSDEAAQAIAQAVTVDLAGKQRSAPDDPRAIDLYLRGKAEMRRSWHSTLDPAVALLEEAHALAPEDASILSTFAIALSRRGFFGGAHHEQYLSRALEAADRASRLAPHSGEPWMALGYARLNAGEFAGAAQAVRRAVDRAPGLARAQELLGILELECDLFDDAMVRLQTAITLDPDTSQARVELARARAYLGDFDGARALLAELPDTDASRFAKAIVEMRFALWQGPDTPPPRMLELRGSMSSAASMAYRMLDVVGGIHRTRAVNEVHRHFLRHNVPEQASVRLRAVQCQMAAEAFGYCGEVDDALSLLAQAVESGLQDQVWIDRCPVLGVIRSDPRFPALRDVVAGRAAAVRAAIRDA